MLLHATKPGHTGENSPKQLTMASYSMNITAVNWSTRQIPSVNATSRKIKSVHFADTKGLALVTTFFFTKEKTSLETFAEREQLQRITTSFRKSFSKQTKSKGECARLLNYKSPIAATQFEENIQTNKVCLEKTYCNRSGVYGRIQVKNIAYEKDITVRYTFNSWVTFNDQKAHHIPGASLGDRDTFFFHIASPCQNSGEQKMEFAVCYQVNGESYWDNNFGDNYRLVYLSS